MRIEVPWVDDVRVVMREFWNEVNAGPLLFAKSSSESESLAAVSLVEDAGGPF